jgi:hypothetical protein
MSDIGITRFVCIGEPQSTSSENLFAFVNEKLNENYLTNHMSKVGFGCDGASNMMGCKYDHYITLVPIFLTVSLSLPITLDFPLTFNFYFSVTFSNTVICAAIHGEGEKINIRLNAMGFSLSMGRE